ncbi:unnamed protein product [Staurois parvus]|uniref:Uncharacterized protein n=1 Tax=Staurois parvus TaxID=386267 RepID=A0ABN9AHM3_9NEOB|nr:unnamed protein product [Staurois parvus]
MISVALAVPPVSAYQCQLSLPINATYQCPSVKTTKATQSFCTVPISASSMPHISAYQCTSMPHISAHLSCLSMSPISASQCHLSMCQSVPPISAANQCQYSASQCRLTVVSAAYQCHLSVLPYQCHI